MACLLVYFLTSNVYRCTLTNAGIYFQLPAIISRTPGRSGPQVWPRAYPLPHRPRGLPVARIVLEDFYHQSCIVTQNYTGLQHAKNPDLTFRLAKGSRSIDRYVSVQSFPDGCDGRKSRTHFERDTGKDQLLAAGGRDGASHARVVECVDRRTVDAWQRVDEFGEGRPPHAVARRRGNDDR